jgi:hypothetical protein
VDAFGGQTGGHVWGTHFVTLGSQVLKKAFPDKASDAEWGSW